MYFEDVSFPNSYTSEAYLVLCSTKWMFHPSFEELPESILKTQGDNHSLSVFRFLEYNFE